MSFTFSERLYMRINDKKNLTNDLSYYNKQSVLRAGR